MELQKQQLLRTGRQNNIGEKDRISELPDSLIHHILSFLDIKCAFCTSLLSKRWGRIWPSIRTLKFPSWNYSKLPSSPEVNKFMDFVDRTLLLHDRSSNIQKFHLKTNTHMSASRIYSWIENLTKSNVEDLSLYLDLREPFFVPSSLFTSKSLIKLKLSACSSYSMTVHLPKSFCCPKLKSLKLHKVEFTNGNSWNEQQFSDCPVLEELSLEDCTWDDVSNFCVSTPTLKLLKLYALDDNGHSSGLQDCTLKINAPNLVSLTYWGPVAKEYVLSSFQTLKSAEVLLCECDVRSEQKTGYGAAASKFLRALSHVQTLEIHAETLRAISIVDDFANILPVFHDLENLALLEGFTTDKLVFSLLKAVPNLRWLLFEESCLDEKNDREEEESWAGHMLTAGCMFQHLESVTFHWWYSGDARQMRWLKLILKNAKALKTVCLEGIRGKRKDALKSELPSLPRASEGCKFEFREH